MSWKMSVSYFVKVKTVTQSVATLSSVYDLFLWKLVCLLLLKYAALYLHTGSSTVTDI